MSLRLEGRSANRDGIGARVEVVPRVRSEERGSQRIAVAKTLHAGDGFLTQSSKWLHVGLGQQDEIERVVVHWPGGEREEFTGVQADGRYRLMQGSGTPQRVAGERRNVELNSSELAAPPSTGHAHIWLASRVPMPLIRYRDFTGTEVELDRTVSGPVLLNLWASWCPPCLTELGEFARHEAELRDSGLNIVALSVDGLGDDRSAGPDQLRQRLARLKYTWRCRSG